jgi:hypothetical protein
MNFFRSALGTALLGIFAAAAPAQTVIVNDLVSSSSNPVQTWNGLTMVGQSFTATASGSITSFTLNLTTSNSSTTPVYSVALWSTNGQSTPKPSTLLATFVSSQHWSTVYSATQNPANTITFNSSGFGQNYDLVSGTTYWVVISSSTGVAKAWGVSGTDIGDTATFNGSWSNVTLAGSLGMSLSVQSAIPEPGTYALLAGVLALGGAIIVRRRQQARAGIAAA